MPKLYFQLLLSQLQYNVLTIISCGSLQLYTVLAPIMTAADGQTASEIKVRVTSQFHNVNDTYRPLYTRTRRYVN